MNTSKQAEAGRKAADRADLLVKSALDIVERKPLCRFLIDGGFHLGKLAKQPISLKNLAKPFRLKEWEKHSLSKEDLGKESVRKALLAGHLFGMRQPASAHLLGIDIDGFQNKQASRAEYLRFLVSKLGNPLAWKESESKGKEETSAHAWWEVEEECAEHYLANPKAQPDAWLFKGKEAGDIRFARNNPIALHGDEVCLISNGLKHPIK